MNSIIVLEVMENLLKSTESGLNLKNVQMDDTIVESRPQTREKDRKGTWTGFEDGDWERAIQQKKTESNRYYKGKQISGTVQLEFFRSYGAGIYLFFTFMWKITLLFLFMTVLSIVPITLNTMYGSAFQSQSLSLQILVSRGTIGNYEYSLGYLTSSQSVTFKIINASFDLFCCFIFVVFYMYWEHKSQKIVDEINSQIKLLSSSTLQIVQFPENSTENEIQDFMNQFGQISEVAAVKNYSNDIQYSKKIFDLETQIKQLSLADQIDEEQILKLKAEVKQVQQKMDHSEVADRKILKFYVQFEQISKRNETLKKFRKYQRFMSYCYEKMPSEMLFKGTKLRIQGCNTEPTGIIWQNVHVTWSTRWMRSLFQLLIILIILAIGFIVVCLLNALLPPSQTSVDISSYTYSSVTSTGNSTLINAWCVSNLDYKTSSPYYSGCIEYWVVYYQGILLTVGISLAIIVFKNITKQVMIFLGKFQKYTSHTQQSVAIMTNLLVSYFLTTVLITFLMQANVFSISFKSLITPFIHDAQMKKNLTSMSEYSDLTSSWYKNICYQIWFNVLLLSFMPHCYNPLVFKLKQVWGEWRGKKQKLYSKMLQKIRPPEFELEDSYANVLLMVFSGFIFGGGNPFMMVLLLVGLWTRYLSMKYTFIRFNRVPKAINQALNTRAVTILKIILLIRCLISIYMYGASDIFAEETNTFTTWLTTWNVPIITSILTVVSRLFATWYYSLFVIVFILIMIFHDLMIQSVLSLCKREKEPKEQGSCAQNINDNREVVSQRSLTKSYKLEKSPDYMEILAIMKMRRRINSGHSQHKQSLQPVFIKGDTPLSPTTRP